MSTGQRLREVKEEIARIERFLPVMKRVLALLRVEIRAYQQRLEDLSTQLAQVETRWQAESSRPLALTIEAATEVEVLTRPESLVGVDIEELVSVRAHSQLSQVFSCASALSIALGDLAGRRARLAESLRIERQNVAALEEAEEEFVFLINGSEQVRLPPLHEELARLARQLDEENGMAAMVARLLRERADPGHLSKEGDVWPPLA